ncbi:hypothetical protein IAI10_18045 [Clostridium sp. 19966]|uniref:Flp1 family type IVb pilin n=1 Tax=Clostridium sp. 19966 TaxID=2768166 RepID=UPI0028DF0A9E|nr:Flp1 family type IVb pilin [Clostridium sp. 19966]MDT8718570.1 hypothetical protein [Clostridium sp. 19966]
MNVLKNFFKEEDGLATLEIALIIVVLIALVIIFRKSIEQLVTNIMSNITKSADDAQQSTTPTTPSGK